MLILAAINAGRGRENRGKSGYEIGHETKKEARPACA